MAGPGGRTVKTYGSASCTGLAGIVATALAQADTSHPVASAVPDLIRQRCEDVRNRFRN